MTLTLSSDSRLFCCAGRELVVGDEDVEAGLALRLEQLLGLALAHVPVGIDVAAVLPLGADDVRARRGRERGELGQAVLGGPALRRRRCRRRQERLLDGRGEVDRSRCGAMDRSAYRADSSPRLAGSPSDERVEPARAMAGSRVARSRRRPARPGSRRNQVRLALGELATLPLRVEPIAASRASARRRGTPSSRGSRSRRATAGPGRSARGARAPPRRGRRRTGPGRARAIRRRCSPGSTTSWTPSDGARIADGRRAAARRRGARDLEGAGDAARVAQVGPRGQGRGERVSVARRRPRRRRAPARASIAARTCRVRRERVRVDPARRRPAARSPVPPARIADAAALRDRRERGQRVGAEVGDRDGSSGSTRSRPWWTTRARSAGVAFAVPMSRPR